MSTICKLRRTPHEKVWKPRETRLPDTRCRERAPWALSGRQPSPPRLRLDFGAVLRGGEGAPVLGSPYPVPPSEGLLMPRSGVPSVPRLCLGVDLFSFWGEDKHGGAAWIQGCLATNVA